MTTLKDLEKRLEEATEEDRELDSLISRQFFDMSQYVERRTGYFVHVNCLDDPERGEWDVSHFTDSLDAAVELADRVLPGWAWVIHTLDGHPFARLQSPDYAAVTWEAGDKVTTDVAAGRDSYAQGVTPALALCLATVRALIAKGGASG